MYLLSAIFHLWDVIKSIPSRKFKLQQFSWRRRKWRIWVNNKYVVTLFGKADDFSYLSNLTFWKLISFYVKDYLKQESIKIPIYLFYLTFHNMLIDKKNFCISKCILYFTSHTSNKVWHSCGAYWIIWSPVFGKDTGSNSCRKVWQEVVKFWSTYWGWQQNCSPDR